jgi:hypothetical protein
MDFTEDVEITLEARWDAPKPVFRELAAFDPP